MNYTEQQFKDGCYLNLWMGAAFGIVFILVFEILFMWARGWI